MLPLAIAFAAKGFADSERDKEEKQAQQKADAVAIKYSPWSGLNTDKLVGKSYHADSPLSGVLAGGAAGAQLSDNIQNANADSEYRKTVADYYKSKLGINPSTPAPAEAAKVAAPRLSPYGGLNVPMGEDLLKGQAVQDNPYNSFGVA